MKKISHLIKEFMNGLAHPLNVRRPVANKKMAEDLDKELSNYLKQKENKTLASDQQRELLYHFMHFHTDN